MMKKHTTLITAMLSAWLFASAQISGTAILETQGVYNRCNSVAKVHGVQGVKNRQSEINLNEIRP